MWYRILTEYTTVKQFQYSKIYLLVEKDFQSQNLSRCTIQSIFLGVECGLQFSKSEVTFSVRNCIKTFLGVLNFRRYCNLTTGNMHFDIAPFFPIYIFFSVGFGGKNWRGRHDNTIQVNTQLLTRNSKTFNKLKC